MTQYETEAILIAVRNWGEADRMVTFLSREYGKVSAIAYGCRRPKNRLAGGMQLFSQADLLVMPGKSLDTVKQCEVKQSFRLVREDLSFMAYAAFVTEIISEFCPERQPEPLIYDLLVHVLSTITQRNPRLVALAAAWQLLALAGFNPEWGQCAQCGRAIDNNAYFAPKQGGILCSECEHDGLLTINSETTGFIENLQSLNWEKPPAFSVNGGVLVQSEKILVAYLIYLLEKPLKSLEFIRQVTSIPASH